MIKTDKIEIIIYNKELKHYKQFFPDIKQGDRIIINLNMLKSQSKKKIDVICDICGKERIVYFCDYKRITKDFNEKYYCKDCKWIKTKETNLKKYGVENVFQNEDIKNKIKETNIEKFGFDHPLKNEDIKKKRKLTSLERYGVDHHLKNEFILDKLKKTNLLRYGNECSLLNDEVRLKTTKTNIEKYGIDIPLKNKDVINKLIQTNNIRYNNNCPLQNDEIRKKSLEKLFNNFGVYNPLKSEVIKIKVKETKINNLLIKYENLNIININYDSQEYEFRCDCGEQHNFLISSTLLYNRLKIKTKLCTICNKVNSYNNSGMQIQLTEFIKNVYNNIELNDRKILYPNEIDIYIPDLKIAFEFNGVYWHNELNKSNNYHFNKTELCEKQGIHLIHIYEDDWIYKQDIIKSRILNLLGKTPNKIYGRKCIIKEVIDNSLVRSFLESNHQQGFAGSMIKLGLFYNDELVSLMTFGKQRKSMGSVSKENVYEMLRFCNKLNTSVIGGADKLFKHFIKTYKPLEVLSYADRSWSQGDLYKKLGFTFISKTQSNYSYVIDGIRKYRFGFRKDLLIKEGYDPTKTEHEIMLERKIYRIYDSGSLKFEHSDFFA